MRELVQFGGLTLIGSLGALLYYATDSIMISNLNELGIGEVANYNVAQRWHPQITMFASSFIWILGPAMTVQIATEQSDKVRATVINATRYAYIILAFPCTLLIIHSEPFLRLWLKSVFVPRSVPVLRAIMCALLLSGAGLVAKEALYACRKIREAVVAILVGGVLNVVLSITLVKVAGLGLFGIALGSLVTLVLLQVICLPWLLCRKLSLKPMPLVSGALRALLGATPLAVMALALLLTRKADSLTELLVQFALCGLVYAPAVWFISMTRNDRKRLIETIRMARRGRGGDADGAEGDLT
jgi:O-antigen/teichoic acid export membrane protein